MISKYKCKCPSGKPKNIRLIFDKSKSGEYNLICDKCKKVLETKKIEKLSK